MFMRRYTPHARFLDRPANGEYFCGVMSSKFRLTMNMHSRVYALVLRLAQTVALVVAVCLMPGCTSTGYHKGDVAAVGMQRAANEVQAESHAMDQTMATLRDLVTAPQGDLRVPFKRYSKSLDR